MVSELSITLKNIKLIDFSLQLLKVTKNFFDFALPIPFFFISL